MSKITDKQRLDAIEKCLKNDKDFVLEIQNFDEDEGDEESEPSLQMFTCETQWVDDDSVRQLLDKLVIQQRGEP